MMHTPGPWVRGGLPLLTYGRLARDYIIGAGGELVAELNAKLSNHEANAQRIVSCVNGCSVLKNPIEDIARLRRERTELLCALDELTQSAIIHDARSASAISTACNLSLRLKARLK